MATHCLENSLDREARRATVHGVTKESDMTEWLTLPNIYIPIFNFGDENWKIRGGGKRDVRKDCFFSWLLLKCPFLQGKSCFSFNHSRKHSPYQRKWRAGLELCALFSLQLSRFVLCPSRSSVPLFSYWFLLSLYIPQFLSCPTQNGRTFAT